MSYFKKIYNTIEPSFRGLAFMLFALFAHLLYDSFVLGDNSSMLAKHRAITFILNKVDQWGGKPLVVGIFIAGGLLIIINDYLEKKK